MKPRNLLRRVELVEKTRQPAPPDYDCTPHNRQQRRTLKRALAKAIKRASTGQPAVAFFEVGHAAPKRKDKGR